MPDLPANYPVSSRAGQSEPLRQLISNWPSFFAPLWPNVHFAPFCRQTECSVPAASEDPPRQSKLPPAYSLKIAVPFTFFGLMFTALAWSPGQSSPNTPWRESRVTKCRGDRQSATCRRPPAVPPRPVEIIPAHLLQNDVFFAPFGQAFTIPIRSTGSDPTTRGHSQSPAPARPRDSTGAGTVGGRRANPEQAVEQRGRTPAQVELTRECAVPAGARSPCSTCGQARSPVTVPASLTPHHTPLQLPPEDSRRTPDNPHSF